MSTPLLTLRSNIDTAFEGKDRFGIGGFLPVTRLSELVTSVSVRDILNYLLANEAPNLPLPQGIPRDRYIDNLTRFAVDEARQIFAILVMMQVPWHIQSFYSQKLGQSTLPVTQYDLGSIFLIGDRLDETPSWSYADIAQFCSLQWGFISPVLQDGVFERELWEHDQMPYTKFCPLSGSDDPVLDGDGLIKHAGAGPGNSEVEHRCIHRDHLVGLTPTTVHVCHPGPLCIRHHAN